MAEPRLDEEWGYYRRLIVQQLKDLQTDLAVVRGEIQNFRQTELSAIKVEIALLKLKSSLWGALLGSLGGAIVAGVAIISKYL